MDGQDVLSPTGFSRKSPCSGQATRILSNDALRRMGRGAAKWIVDSFWIGTLSILLISAQSFKRCNEVIRRLPDPGTLHLSETTLFHPRMICPAGQGPHLSETKPVSPSNDPPGRAGRGLSCLKPIQGVIHQGHEVTPRAQNCRSILAPLIVEAGPRVFWSICVYSCPFVVHLH